MPDDPTSIFSGITFRQLLSWAILLGAVIYLLYRSSQRIKGKGRLTSKQSRRQARENLQKEDYTEIKNSLERLVIDLQELSRKINAQIDTRFCKLEVLTRQADEKIKKLRQLTDQNADENSTSAQQEDQQSNQQDEDENDPQKQIIYKLADTGKTAEEIANELDKHRGEVELILSLRKSKQGGRIDYRVDD